MGQGNVQPFAQFSFLLFFSCCYPIYALYWSLKWNVWLRTLRSFLRDENLFFTKPKNLTLFCSDLEVSVGNPSIVIFPCNEDTLTLIFNYHLSHILLFSTFYCRRSWLNVIYETETKFWLNCFEVLGDYITEGSVISKTI